MLFCNSWKINDLAGNILNIWSCFWKTSCHVWFKNTSYSIEDDIKATFLRDRMVQSQVGLILSPSCLYVGERSFVRSFGPKREKYHIFVSKLFFLPENCSVCSDCAGAQRDVWDFCLLFLVVHFHFFSSSSSKNFLFSTFFSDTH